MCLLLLNITLYMCKLLLNHMLHVRGLLLNHMLHVCRLLLNHKLHMCAQMSTVYVTMGKCTNLSPFSGVITGECCPEYVE